MMGASVPETLERGLIDEKALLHGSSQWYCEANVPSVPEWRLILRVEHTPANAKQKVTTNNMSTNARSLP